MVGVRLGCAFAFFLLSFMGILGAFFFFFLLVIAETRSLRMVFALYTLWKWYLTFDSFTKRKRFKSED